MLRFLLLTAIVINPLLLLGSTHGQHPRVFMQNTGHWPSAVLFAAATESQNLFITQTGMIIEQRVRLADDKGARHRVIFSVPGASSNSTVETRVDSDAPKITIARAGLPNGGAIPTASAVVVRNVRPGVHLEYVWDGPNVRYNVLADAGVKVPSPLFTIEGATNASVTAAEVNFSTSLGSLNMSGLKAFASDSKQYRQAQMKLVGSTALAFESERTGMESITIDPIVATRVVRGSDWDEFTSITFDRGGNIVAAGWTLSTDLDPGASGAAPTRGSGMDGFVACYTADLQRLLAWTYIAGNGDEAVRGVAVSPTGEIWVTGETMSSNLPVSDRTGGKFSGSQDGFVLKFSNDLARVLAGKYLAGNKDDRPTGITCTPDGDAVVCGQTTSTTGLSLPIGHDVTHNGGWDAFALRIEKTGAQTDFFSYYGTPGDDAFTAVASDRTSSMVFAGWTTSNDMETFPKKSRVWIPDPNDYYNGGYWEETGQNAYDVDFNGGVSDVIIVKFAASGELGFATYYGGALEERASAIVCDGEDRPVVVGTTRSANLQVSEGAVSTISGGSDAFMFRISPDGIRMSAGIYFGGSADEVGTGLALDAQGNAIICGGTTSPDIPNVGPGTTNLIAGGIDGFIAIVSPNGVLYATTFGWNGDDVPYAMIRDGRGDLFLAGVTASNLSGNVSGAADGFVAKWAFGTLTLRNPSTVGTLCPGANVQVSWVTDGIASTSTYSVEYSTNGGESWTAAASGLVTKSYNFVVPLQRPTSGTMRLRVTSTNGHAAGTPGDFTIDAKPVFVTEPQSTSACPGGTITLNPTIDAGEATYQWKHNGEPLAGATQRVLTITNAQPQNEGTYTVVATTACGTTESASATVTVSATPAITEHPQSANVGVGQTITLRVVASGTDLSYQWRMNNAEISGATSSELVIQNATAANSGTYACSVTSACGTSTSNSATVSVGTTSVFEGGYDNAIVRPNPTEQEFVVTTSALLTADAQITLRATNGTDVSSSASFTRVASNMYRVGVASLSAGVYVVSIQDGLARWSTLVTIIR